MMSNDVNVEDEMARTATEDETDYAFTEDENEGAFTEEETAPAAVEDETAYATKEDETAYTTKEDETAYATKEDETACATKEDETAYATKEDETTRATALNEMARVAAEYDTERVLMQDKIERFLFEVETAQAAAVGETTRASKDDETAYAAAESEAAYATKEDETTRATAEDKIAYAAAENEASLQATAENDTRCALTEDETAYVAALNEMARVAAEYETEHALIQDEIERFLLEEETALAAAVGEMARATADDKTAYAAAQYDTGCALTEDETAYAAALNEMARVTAEYETEHALIQDEIERFLLEGETALAAAVDETARAAAANGAGPAGPSEDRAYDAMFERYATGLPTARDSLESLCAEFTWSGPGTKRYTFVRALMRRRGLFPERLPVGPGRPGGRGCGAAAARFMAAGKWTEAFHVYTCQLVDSELWTRARARALDGRSRALYRMGQYEQCERDVRRALSAPWGPPDGLRLDLLCRGGNAARRLGRDAQTVRGFFERAGWTVDALAADGTVSAETAREIRGRLARVPSSSSSSSSSSRRRAPPAPRREDDDAPVRLTGARNEHCPAFSEHLQLRRTADMGLGVFTTRDLEPGDVLAIEDSHIGIPLNDNFYICHNADCHKLNMAVIFCQKCVLVYYCSEKCLNNDNRDGGHKFLCPVLRAIRTLPGNKKINHLALKWFLRESTKMGMDEYCSLINALSRAKIDPFTRKNIKDGKYSNFVAAYSMEINHRNASPRISLFFNCIVVEMLQILLLSGYNIVNYHLPTVATSLVRMLQVLHTNFENFSTVLNFAFSLYPSINQLNHSCDPNVMIRELPDKTTLVLRASRPISKDNQLLISYGKIFFRDDKRVRSFYLEENYGFQCCCQPCKENWPIKEHLPHFITRNQIINPDSYKITLFKCWQYETIRNVLLEMDEKVMQECILGSKNYFFSFMKFLQTYVKRPFYLFEDCHDIILRVNSLHSFDADCSKLFYLMSIVNNLCEAGRYSSNESMVEFSHE